MNKTDREEGLAKPKKAHSSRTQLEILTVNVRGMNKYVESMKTQKEKFRMDGLERKEKRREEKRKMEERKEEKSDTNVESDPVETVEKDINVESGPVETVEFDVKEKTKDIKQDTNSPQLDLKKLKQNYHFDRNQVEQQNRCIHL